MTTKWIWIGGQTVVGERDGAPFIAYTNANNIDAMLDRVNDHYGQIVENGEWPFFEDWMVDAETPAPPAQFPVFHGVTCVGKLWLNESDN